MSAGFAYKPSAPTGEPITVDGDGCVWSGTPPANYATPANGVPLGYRSLKPITDRAASMQALLVVMPGWSIENGLVLIVSGGFAFGFCRPAATKEFGGALSTHGKVAGAKVGLVRPLSVYHKAQVTHAIFYVEQTPGYAGMLYKTSLFG